MELSDKYRHARFPCSSIFSLGLPTYASKSQTEGVQRLEQARIAFLATASLDLRPHLVPVVFAVVDSSLVTALDGKPKGSLPLRRITNISANSQVSLLVHHYEEDWSQLWWLRIDGRATVTGDHPTGRQALLAKYPQYASVPLPGPFISIEIEKVSEWSAQPPDSQ